MSQIIRVSTVDDVTAALIRARKGLATQLERARTVSQTAVDAAIAVSAEADPTNPDEVSAAAQAARRFALAHETAERAVKSLPIQSLIMERAEVKARTMRLTTPATRKRAMQLLAASKALSGASRAERDAFIVSGLRKLYVTEAEAETPATATEAVIADAK